MENNPSEHMNIKFDLPTSWRHGRGIVSETGSMLLKLGCTKPLILTDNLLLSSGMVKPVIMSLDNAGIQYTVCDDVNMEPTVKERINIKRKPQPGVITRPDRSTSIEIPNP